MMGMRSGSRMGMGSGSRTIVAVDALTKFRNTVTDARLAALYHTSKNLVASSGNLVTWDDVRGSVGFGPTLLPNGGAGGTAPTVSGGTVNTDGVASYIRNATASSVFALGASKFGFAIWGDWSSPPTYRTIAVTSDASSNFVIDWLSGGNHTIYNWANTSPKATPAAGVKSLLVGTLSQATGIQLAAFDFVGRCMTFNGNGWSVADATGYLSLGKYSTLFGNMKVRGVVWLNDVWLPSDRAALEALVTDATLGDSVDLYGQTDSTGQIICFGDSLTYGYASTTPSQTTPVSATGTGYPPKLQALINAAGKKIDVINEGHPGDTAVGKLTGTPSSLDTWCAYCSPARQAAGLKDIVILRLGINDIGASTVATIEAALTQGIASIKASGAKAVITTIDPAFTGVAWASEPDRLALNTWILANSAGAALAFDMRTITDPNNANIHPYRDPGVGDNPAADLTYYQADNLHNTDLGYSLAGTGIYNALVSAGLI